MCCTHCEKSAAAVPHRITPSLPKRSTRSTVQTLRALGLAGFVLAISLERAPAIVGYVNVAVTNGFNFLANPLDNPPNNVTNVISVQPDDGTEVFLWNVTNQAFSAPSTYFASQGGWDLKYDLLPGKGFVVLALSQWTNTFVGNTITGTSTNPVPGTNKFSLLGSKIPVAAALSDPPLNFPGADGDTVLIFKTSTQSYLDGFDYFNGFGWFDPAGSPGTSGPVIAIAQSFFIQNPNADTNWIIVFNPPAGPNGSTAGVSATSPQTGSPRLARTSTTSAAPEIQSISAPKGKIALGISNPTGATYDVQFSSDGISWKTIARNRTGPSWSGPNPGGAQGYFRLTTP